METFWEWLMRANARALYACALIVLIGAAGWWTWKEFQPADTLAPISVGSIQDRPHMPLGVLALLQRQIEEGSPVPDNLFLISEKPRPKLPIRPRKPVTIRPEPPPPPPKPKEVVRLTYRGFATRPDGQVQIWIEDSQTSARRFYLLGDTLRGWKVGQADFASLQISDADGNRISLPFGQPQTFEDGRHVP